MCRGYPILRRRILVMWGRLDAMGEPRRALGRCRRAVYGVGTGTGCANCAEHRRARVYHPAASILVPHEYSPRFGFGRRAGGGRTLVLIRPGSELDEVR